MAMTQVWCSVAGEPVVRTTDLEGQVMQIICVEYDASTGACRLRSAARKGGPLTQLLEGVAEHTLAAHGTQCVLRA